MNEHFYMKMHLADTPQRGNAKHFGAGVARNITIYRNVKLMCADTPQRGNAKHFGAGVARKKQNTVKRELPESGSRFLK